MVERCLACEADGEQGDWLGRCLISLRSISCRFRNFRGTSVAPLRYSLSTPWEETGQLHAQGQLSNDTHALASEAALHKYFPTGQALNELLPVGRRLRLWYRGVMPSEYENQGIDHRDYGLHDRQGPEVPGF